MTQDTESGKQSEDGPEDPVVSSSPEPDGIETTLESDDTKYHDWKRLRNTVHSLSNDVQDLEEPSVPPPSHSFSRHVYGARDGATEDETSGTSSLCPSPSNSEDGDYLDDDEESIRDGDYRDDDEGSIRRSTGAPPDTTSSPTGTTSSNGILRFIPNWAHDIFSRDRYDDQKSDKLEAFLLELPARTDLKSKLALTRLEIEHTHVKAALSATMPRRWHRGRPQMWEKYKGFDPRVRHEIHHAITLAKQWNNQSRTWIATEFMQSSELNQQESVHVVLFFRLGDEVEPVSLDAGSRKFILPYEHCRTWEMMENILIQAFTNTESEDEVRNGRYDIVNNDTYTIIPPRTWRSVILPGMDLRMNMWSLQRRVFRAMPGDGRLRQQAGAPGKRVTLTAGRRPMPPPPPPVTPVGVRPVLPPNIATRLSPRKEERKEKLRIEVKSPYWERMILVDNEPTTNIDKHELDEEMNGLLGLKEGNSDEIDTSGLGLGELLMRWTNAPDAGGNDVLSSDMSDK